VSITVKQIEKQGPEGQLPSTTMHRIYAWNHPSPFAHRIPDVPGDDASPAEWAVWDSLLEYNILDKVPEW
jgi:hypothetical protein